MSCIRLGPLAAALRILPPNHALHSAPVSASVMCHSRMARGYGRISADTEA